MPDTQTLLTEVTKPSLKDVHMRLDILVEAHYELQEEFNWKDYDKFTCTLCDFVRDFPVDQLSKTAELALEKLKSVYC